MTVHGRQAPSGVFLAVILMVVACPGLAAEGASEPLLEATTDGSGFSRRPRFEVGIGGGYFGGFDYPASRSRNARGLALPFFIYRSPVLRVGDGGIRAVAIEQPKLRLEVSAGLSLSASSEGNDLREGLPDLDFLLELGPKLEMSLIDRRVDSGGRFTVETSVDLRAVAGIGLPNVRARGFKAEIGLDAARRRIFGSGVDLIAGLNVTFADERLQDYFYEVEPRFVTAERGRHDARAGYLGSGLFLAAALRPRPGLRIFIGLQYANFAGAANQDSPLFETTASTSGAIGFAWTVLQSKRTIEVIEND